MYFNLARIRTRDLSWSWWASVHNPMDHHFFFFFLYVLVILLVCLSNPHILIFLSLSLSLFNYIKVQGAPIFLSPTNTDCIFLTRFFCLLRSYRADDFHHWCRLSHPPSLFPNNHKRIQLQIQIDIFIIIIDGPVQSLLFVVVLLALSIEKLHSLDGAVS